jgi:hypothetical protein
MREIERWTAIGQEAIVKGSADVEPLPWIFQQTVFRCAWEYPVVGFEAEVGFYLDALGFTTIALDHDYALFTTPEEDFTFACRRHHGPNHDLTGHVLCFMTNNVETFAEAIVRRVPEGAVTRRDGSPVQTVLGLQSPAGLQIDIWEDPRS